MRHAIITGLVAALFVVGTCSLAQASGRKAQPPQKKLPPATAFDKADTNHDGTVSKSEFAKYEKSLKAGKSDAKAGAPKAAQMKTGAPKAGDKVSKGKSGAPAANKDMRREGPKAARGQRPQMAREGRDGGRGERFGAPERRGNERARRGFDAEARRMDIRRRFEREHGPASQWSPEMRRQFKETMHREMRRQKSEWRASRRGMGSREGTSGMMRGNRGMGRTQAPNPMMRGERGMGMRGQGGQGPATGNRPVRPEGMARDSGFRGPQGMSGTQSRQGTGGAQGMSAEQRREAMGRLWRQSTPDERRAFLREMAGGGAADSGQGRGNVRAGDDRQELSGQDDVLENWQLLKDMGIVP